MLRKILLSLFLASLTAALAGCGGSSGNTIGDTDTIDGGDSSTGDTDNGDTVTPTSDITYFPLQVYMQGDMYVPEDVFDGIWFDPLIHGYMIAPVDATTLQPATAPSVEDFVFTTDGADVNVQEQGLMMQKVLGLDVSLTTAIIIDTSGSTQPVDKAALIQEVKDYINQVKASSDPTIKGQQFTLWAYGTYLSPLVGSFTTSATVLETALNNLQANWDGRGESSAAYEAIFKAIGSYADGVQIESGVGIPADFYDDLKDSYTFNAPRGSGRMQLNGINLSSIVLFAAGPNTRNDFQLVDAEAALQWQSFIVYDEEASNEGTSDDDTAASDSDAAQEGTTLLPKPMIYVSLGDSVDSDLSDLSASVIDTGSFSDFSGVAEQVIAAQQSAVAVRTRPENQYLVRYELFERWGDHELIFASNTAGYNYTLTTDLGDMDGSIGYGSPVVEIAGPGNAYLANGEVSLSDATTLYPATRWTSVEYDSSHYSWAGGGVVNSDGSLDISGLASGTTITLTNTTLGQSASVVVK